MDFGFKEFVASSKVCAVVDNKDTAYCRVKLYLGPHTKIYTHPSF